MQKAITLLLCLGGIGLLSAQDIELISKHEIILTIGLNQSLLKDSNFSPLHYRGQGALYGLEYRLSDKSNKGTFIVGLGFGTGKYKIKISDELTTDYILGDFSLGYLRRIKEPTIRIPNIALGGRYHFNINYLDWEDQNSFSFLANHSFDFSTAVNYQLNERHRFHAKLDVPLLSLAVRPPYNGNDEELGDNNNNHPVKLITNGYWTSFNHLISYDLELKYNYRLSDQFTLDFIYLNRYQNLSNIHKFVSFQNQFKLGTSLLF